MGWHGDHMGWWNMAWGWTFIFLLLAAVVALVLMLIRFAADRGRGERPASRATERSRAQEILDERYARGEIDTTEYGERRQGLENTAKT